MVTDGGSTKQDVIAYARRFLGDSIRALRARASDRGHREKRRAGGVRGALRRTQRDPDAAAAKPIARALSSCGGVGSVRRASIALEAAEHDEIFARGEPSAARRRVRAGQHARRRRRCARRCFEHSGGGLRDTSRIAGSSPEMWRDICIANRDALLAALDDYLDELERARG